MSRRFGTSPMPCVLLFLAVFAACGRESEPLESPPVRDSAGVRIVENRVAPESLPTWTVSAEPLTVFGGEEGLYRVSGAVRLEGGGVAVGLAGDLELRMYEPDGSIAWRYGREGEGPGEFRAVHAIRARAADSIGVWDFRARRLTLLHLSGDGASFVRFEATPLVFASELGEPTSDGTYLEKGFHMEKGRSEVAYARFDRAGRFIALLEAPAPRIVYREQGNIRMPLWFSPEPHFAGTAAAFWLGPGDREEIREYDPEGGLVRIVRWPAEDRRVREEDVERLGGMTLDSPMGTTRIDAQDLAVADIFPAYSDLRVDRADRVWIRRYPRPSEGEPSRWMVFDPDGRLAARVEVPLTFEIHDIGPDWIVGVVRDEMDLERVELRRLVRIDPS